MVGAMDFKRIISVILIAAVALLSSCGGGDSTANDKTDLSDGVDDMFSDGDLEVGYDENESVRVFLSGNGADSESDAVAVTDGRVTLLAEATYIISGELSGTLLVDAPKDAKPRIVFDGVSIRSEGACLLVLSADKVFVTLADGSENSLDGGVSYSLEDGTSVDGAIFSKADISLNGGGSLTVTASEHGLVAKDDLTVTGGTYEITAASDGIDANDSIRIQEASFKITSGKDGLHAENSDGSELGFIYISSGSFDINAGGDGLDAGAYLQIEDGSFSVKTEAASSDSSAKGLKATGELLINGGIFTLDTADDAVHSNSSAYINGGKFRIATGDDGFHADDTLSVTGGDIIISESYEGLEGLHVKVSGGDIRLTASDDGINAAGGTDSSGFGGGFGGDQFRPGGPGGGMRPGGKAVGGSSAESGSIVISGGTLYIVAYGDGLDANGTLEISGGHTTVTGPTTGDTATLDFDATGIITGGTFIGTGASSGMAQTFSDSEQGVFAVSAGRISGGTEVTLTSSDGSVVLKFTPELDFSVIILSSPEIKKGECYTVTVGELSGEFEAD